MQQHREEDAFMIPGMGAQPVPPPKYVAGNDNVPGCRGLTYAGGQYIGLTRHEGYDPQPLRPLGERHGDWLQTYTGKKFWPLDPRSQEVDIRDIAHALSMQCRYAGHCRRFYSVAEHSTLIARWLVGVNKPAAIYGLLHDASEAYLCDVPRPVKPYLNGYAAAENKVQAAIWAHFGLGPDVPSIVKEADDRILADELVNMTRMDWHARHADPLGVPMMYWSPAEAEEEFLATFEALTGRVV
jgi:hypothetical protein